VPDEFDLEVELERHELVDLLSRAMAMLPANTRTILIERYVGDATHAEIAERLNLSEGAVRVRVHRGKVALDRVLTEHFTEDLVAYGFGASDPTPWEFTRIWCPLCGNRRLTIRVDRALGTVISRCGDYCPELDDNITETQDRRVAEGLKSNTVQISGNGLQNGDKALGLERRNPQFRAESSRIASHVDGPFTHLIRHN